MVNYIVWILIGILYTPVFHSLYSFRWDKVDYTHAYFILPISLWLAWRKRAQLKKISQADNIKYSWLGLSVFSIGIVTFIFGWREDYLFVTTLSLIPVLYGLIICLYGFSMAKSLLFPVLYLLLMVPPPFGILDSITLPMRHGTSVTAEVILRLFDYPVTRDGLLLTIGYNDIFMGQPCSGFRSLITMFSLVLVYVYLSKGSLSQKLILTSFIVPITLLGNVVRVITLCLITFYFGEEVGQGFFHNFSGIVIFIITILGLIGAETLLGMKNESI